MRRRFFVVGCLFIVIAAAGCAKPMMNATVIKDIYYESDDYAAVPNDVYYAIRWAMKENGYAVDEENLSDGVITSTWIPVKSDSHYIPMFGRREYGVTSSYYQLKIQVVSEEGRTRVKVGTRIKTLVSNLTSSGIEEKKLLAGIGDYLRKKNPDLTNLGVNE